jgi:hypothetical protein
MTYVEMTSENEENSRYLTFSEGTTEEEKFQDYSIKTLGVAREKKFQAALETDLGPLISEMEAVLGENTIPGGTTVPGRHCWREGTLRDGR